MLRMAVLTSSLLLMAVTCQEVPENGGSTTPITPSSSAAIRFGGRTGVGTGAGTKTTYSGVVTDGRERLDWVAGDRVAIVSPEAKPHISASQPYSKAPYKIAGPKDSAYISKASLLNLPAGEGGSTGNGLQWDTQGTYQFYGMYPDSSSMDATDRSKVSIAWNGSAGSLNAFIPKVQSSASAVTTTSTRTWIWPDMRYAYMYAAAKATVSAAQAGAGSWPEVPMDFYPMITTFQFTVKASAVPAEEVTIDRFELVSESCALAADYTASVTIGEATTAVPSGSAATYAVPSYNKGVNDTIRFLMPTGGVKVDADKEAVFTVFAVPKGISYKVPKPDSTTITDLTVRFRAKIADGDWKGRSLQLMPKEGTTPGSGVTLSAKGYVEFPAGKKINISGLTLPTQDEPWRFTVDAADLINEPSDVVVNPVRMREWDEVDGGRLDQKSYTVTLPDTLKVPRGTFLQLTATVTDPDSNPVTPASVEWDALSLDASLAALTPVAGISATVKGLKAGTAGTVTASVTIAGTKYTSNACTIIVTATTGSTSAYGEKPNPGFN